MDDRVAAKSGEITGISGKKDFTVIALEKTLMNRERGYCNNILSILEHNGISFETYALRIDSLSLVIDDSQLEDKLDKVLEEIENKCTPDS